MFLAFLMFVYQGQLNEQPQHKLKYFISILSFAFGFDRLCDF